MDLNKLLILIPSIRQDLNAIAKIYDELEHHPLTPDAGTDTLIVIAYYLHNLYNAFENIFVNIAKAFENSLDDAGRWHTQLLERMRLDVMPLRPAVIDEVAYNALDELRRFRHMFRHAYLVKLEAIRLQLTLNKALALKALYATQIDQFLAFLTQLRDNLIA
jgi:hypothetical protein